MTGADLVRKLVEVSEQYYDCADRMDKLIKAIDFRQ
jgi:hypothetical protein